MTVIDLDAAIAACQAIADAAKAYGIPQMVLGATACRDAILALPPVQPDPLGAEWMPIATAPKDGTRIMAYWPDIIGNDSAAQVETWFGPRTTWENACWQNAFEWGDGHNDPTFWQPLSSRPGTPTIPGPTDEQLDRAALARPKVRALVADLEWYGEQARLARVIHSEGDKGRHMLASDGGSRASAALAALPKGVK